MKISTAKKYCGLKKAKNSLKSVLCLISEHFTLQFTLSTIAKFMRLEVSMDKKT